MELRGQNPGCGFILRAVRSHQEALERDRVCPHLIFERSFWRVDCRAKRRNRAVAEAARVVVG
jgi:hypothetical protein